MRRIIFGLIFLLLINSVFAAEMDLDALNKELVGKTIPQPLDQLFGDEQVNIHFNLENGEKLTLGLTTKDGKFKTLTVGELKEASLNVYSSESTVKRIESAKDPSKALKEAFQKKEITYKAVGFFNKIKFSVLSMIIQISGGFSEEEQQEVAQTEKTQDKEETTETDDDKETTETEDTETEDDDAEDTEDTDAELETEDDEEETAEELTGPKTHIVKLIDSGFEMASVTIKVGDTVEWHNVHTKNPKKAMVVGAQKCSKVKSGFYMPGEFFGWTFDKAETCVIVDAIFATQTMKVIIEE